MPPTAGVPLDRTLSVFGLAKNTGKTQTMMRVLATIHESGRTVGLSTIGRDGEARDVVDRDIRKPAIRLPAGSLFVTTGRLLAKAGRAAEVVQVTGYRTAMGPVLLARMREEGKVEIAGPVTAAQTRDITRRLFEFGADRVLIDGAVDRRCAAAPSVAGSVVMATGAVVHPDLAAVVERTVEAVQLLTLPRVHDPAVHELMTSGSALVTSGHGVVPLAQCATFAGPATGLGRVFARHPDTTHILLHGALCHDFAGQVLESFPGSPPVLVVRDATKVFLRPGTWRAYRHRGLRIQVLRTIDLAAITVNPVSPGRYRFDSAEFCARVSSAVPGVPVCDVLNPQSVTAVEDALTGLFASSRTVGLLRGYLDVAARRHQGDVTGPLRPERAAARSGLDQAVFVRVDDGAGPVVELQLSQQALHV